jgi:hypothetical protein
MSGITVLSPVGINRVGSQPIAARLRSLDGVKLRILNNSKPNSLDPQRRVVELLAKQHSVGGVVLKPSAAIGADGLDAYAREVGVQSLGHTCRSVTTLSHSGNSFISPTSRLLATYRLGPSVAHDDVSGLQRGAPCCGRLP